MDSYKRVICTVRLNESRKSVQEHVHIDHDVAFLESSSLSHHDAHHTDCTKNSLYKHGNYLCLPLYLGAQECRDKDVTDDTARYAQLNCWGFMTQLCTTLLRALGGVLPRYWGSLNHTYSCTVDSPTASCDKPSLLMASIDSALCSTYTLVLTLKRQH